MKGEIITVETEDKLILQGMCCLANEGRCTDVCVIHVHGSYGNFYENFFLKEMADAYGRLGVSFISINTRGRDYLADFKSLEGSKYSSTRIGGIRETFQECEYDIAAWVCLCQTRGLSRVILQGHSLGAMKVAYYLSRNPDAGRGLILVSPPDNIGLQKAYVGERYDEYLDQAKKLAERDQTLLMPEKAYFDPITGRAYLSMFDKPEDTGMFTYGDVDLMRRAGMGAIRHPILATFGTIDEAVRCGIDECEEALRSAVSSGDLLHCEIIDGANHSYHFREKKLAGVIAQWLEKTILGGK